MTGRRNPRVREPVEVQGRAVLVVGAGRSGIAAARLLAELGGRVVVSDVKPLEELGEEALELGSLGVRLVGRVRDLSPIGDVDLAVVSPGVPPDAPMMHDLHTRGIPVIGELELGWQYCPSAVIAVTGTNGKGTTCRLVYDMLVRAGVRAALAGNIGNPLCGIVGELSEEHWAVIETSSFQLMTTRTFAPHAAAVLNVTADHLDWHRSFEEYVECKSLIFRRQRPEDLAVAVVDDPTAARLLEEAPAQRVGVSSGDEGQVTYSDGVIKLELPGRPGLQIDVEELADWGRYHRLNAMVAAALAVWAGADAESVRGAIAEYEHPEHLLKEVGRAGGVVYVDDSKATNVAAAVADLEHLARKGPVVVVTGGKDKGADLRPWAAALRMAAKGVVVMGETGEAIAALAGHPTTRRARTMEEAVRMAAELAKPGDTVALIPAASSFDMFADYADRGRRFTECVVQLAEGP